MTTPTTPITPTTATTATPDSTTPDSSTPPPSAKPDVATDDVTTDHDTDDTKEPNMETVGHLTFTEDTDGVTVLNSNGSHLKLESKNPSSLYETLVAVEKVRDL